MLQKFVWTTNVQKLTEADLRDDSAKFATGGRDTVSGWTISGGEYFSGNDKSSNIGTKILEEVCEAVEEYKSLGIVCSASKFIESEAHNDEENSENGETHQLDWLAAPWID